MRTSPKNSKNLINLLLSYGFRKNNSFLSWIINPSIIHYIDYNKNSYVTVDLFNVKYYTNGQHIATEPTENVYYFDLPDEEYAEIIIARYNRVNKIGYHKNIATSEEWQNMSWHKDKEAFLKKQIKN